MSSASVAHAAASYRRRSAGTATAGQPAISGACTLLALVMYPHFELSNLAMVYLLGVTVAGLRLGRGPSAVTAVLNVASFDFFFVPPRFTFAVSDAQYLVTFAAMLTIALVIATLTASVRQQTRVAGARERRTARSVRDEPRARRDPRHREHGARGGPARRGGVPVQGRGPAARRQRQAAIPARCGARELPFAARTSPSRSGSPTTAAAPGSAPTPCRRRRRCTSPLGDERRTVGVLAVLPNNPRRVLLPEQSHLLDTFAGPDRARARARAARRDCRSLESGGGARERCATRCSHRSRTTCARRSP